MTLRVYRIFFLNRLNTQEAQKLSHQKLWENWLKKKSDAPVTLMNRDKGCNIIYYKRRKRRKKKTYKILSSIIIPKILKEQTKQKEEKSAFDLRPN